MEENQQVPCAVERFMLGDATVEEALKDAQKEVNEWVKGLN